MRISDWSSDVCSSDLVGGRSANLGRKSPAYVPDDQPAVVPSGNSGWRSAWFRPLIGRVRRDHYVRFQYSRGDANTAPGHLFRASDTRSRRRSEEHTSELQSLMRISSAVFCLKKTTT